MSAASTPSSRSEDVPAGRDRGLGELQLAHVALGEEHRASAGSSPRQCSTNTRSSPIFVSRAASSGDRSRRLLVGDEAPGVVEQPGVHELGDGVDEPRAAHPDRLGVADHLERRARRRRSERPRSRRRRRASRTGSGPPRTPGPAGAAVASTRSRGAERDLAVGADVDEQPQPAVARQAGREHPGDDVAADVGAERGEHERRAPAGAPSTPKSSARDRRQVVRGDDERRHRERLGVDPERQRHHRHVAADGDLVDLAGGDGGLGADLARSARPSSRAARSRSAASAPASIIVAEIRVITSAP